MWQSHIFNFIKYYQSLLKNELLRAASTLKIFSTYPILNKYEIYVFISIKLKVLF